MKRVKNAKEDKPAKKVGKKIGKKIFKGLIDTLPVPDILKNQIDDKLQVNKMGLDDLELNVQSIKTDKLPEILRRRTWMRFILTGIIFGSFFFIMWLLFTDKFTLDDKFRDLLNIIIGSFLVSFGKVVDFWFKGSHEEEDKQQN